MVLTSRRFATIDGLPNQLAYEHSVLATSCSPTARWARNTRCRGRWSGLRLLNAEIERDYNVGFNDGRTFYVIGTDGGLLSAPVPVTHLIMAPAERYEVLVDLTQDRVGSCHQSRSAQRARCGIEARLRGTGERDHRRARQLAEYRTFTLLRINVGPPTGDAITTLPAKLAENADLATLTLDNASDGTEPRRLGINRGDAGLGAFPMGRSPSTPCRSTWTGSIKRLLSVH